MKNKIKILTKKTTFWLGILAVGLLVGVSLQLVRAWTEPTQAPPGGNVGAPLNTGNVGQAKEGGLILNTSGALNGLIVQRGNAGIGINNPNSSKGPSGYLDVEDIWIRSISKWASELGGGGGGGGYTPGGREFTTPGDFSFTVPFGATRLTVDVWGAGGGGAGGRCSVNYRGETYCINGGSGAAGGYARGIINVSPGQVIEGSVGAGGAWGALSPTRNCGGVLTVNWAGAGERSYFGSLIATGGGGGKDADVCVDYGSGNGVVGCRNNYYAPGGVGSGGNVQNSTGERGGTCGPGEATCDENGTCYYSGDPGEGGTAPSYGILSVGGGGGILTRDGRQPGGGGGAGSKTGPTHGGKGGDGKVVISW